MRFIKNWFLSFMDLFFPSIAAYRNHDREIIEYIENNTIIESNCKRILNLSIILMLIPISGIRNLRGINDFAFIIVLISAIAISIATIIVCVIVGKALRQPGNGILNNKKHFERVYEHYWNFWVFCMILIGFSKLNAGMNGSYLYLTQLCIAFFPLITSKKFKKIGFFTFIFAVMLTANLLFYGTDEMNIMMITFILTNMVLVLIISFFIQRMNLSMNVMMAYTKMVGFIDLLTNVYNRRGVMFRISELVPDKTEAGIIMIDIDFFKQYNDKFGHSRGDEILRMIADTVKASIDRSKCLAVRFGGEEFAVVCLGASEEETKMNAEKIMDAVKKLEIPSAEQSVSPYLTVSIGVDHRTLSRTDSFETIIENADKALYRAKTNGRNRIEY